MPVRGWLHTLPCPGPWPKQGQLPVEGEGEGEEDANAGCRSSLQVVSGEWMASHGMGRRLISARQTRSPCGPRSPGAREGLGTATVRAGADSAMVAGVKLCHIRHIVPLGVQNKEDWRLCASVWTTGLAGKAAIAAHTRTWNLKSRGGTCYGILAGRDVAM